jgi:hypothetical protein
LIRGKYFTNAGGGTNIQDYLDQIGSSTASLLRLLGMLLSDLEDATRTACKAFGSTSMEPLLAPWERSFLWNTSQGALDEGAGTPNNNTAWSAFASRFLG